MNVWRGILTACALSASAAATGQGGPYENSVAIVTSYAQRPDFDAPWKKAPVRTDQHIGTLVAGPYLLVSAWAVGYSTHLEMNRFGDSRRESLEVAFVDYTIGLALLRPVRPEAFAGMRPLELGGDLRIGDQAELVASHEMERSLVVPGRLSDINIDSVVTSSYNVTHYHFEVPGKSAFGKSEPLMKAGKLLGIAVAQADNDVYVMPSKVIRHFLNDRHDDGYRGFVRLGISVKRLESPPLRAWLNATKFQQGVLITHVQESSPFAEKIRKNDILLKIGDMTVSKSGYYQHPLWGPMHFIDRVAEYHGGDKVALTLVRDGRVVVVEEVVQRHFHNQEFIPDYRFKPEPHLIFGGLLFQELSTGFLSSWGATWQKVAPLELVYLTTNSSGAKRDPTEKIIILNRVLADDHNKGYQDFKNMVVEKVNGYPVHSMTQLEDSLRSPLIKNGIGLARIEFRHGLGEVILAYDHLNEANTRIARGYNITTPDSFFKYPPDGVQGTHRPLPGPVVDPAL